MRTRLDVETLRERVRAGEARVVQLEKQRERERDAAAEAARRAVIRRAQREIAADVAAQVPALLDSVDRSVTQARVDLATAESARTAVTQELAELRTQETAIRARLTGLTESVHGLELQIHEKRLHVTSLLERVASELGLDEDVLVAEYGPDPACPRLAATPTAHDEEARLSRPFPSIARVSGSGSRMPSASSRSSAGSIRSPSRSSPRSSSGTSS